MISEVSRRFSTQHETVEDRKSTHLNSSHITISYAVFCLKKKKINNTGTVVQKSRANGNNELPKCDKSHPNADIYVFDSARAHSWSSVAPYDCARHTDPSQ